VLALVLLAGADDLLDEARARLRSMSPERRTQLAETLKRFDLQVPEDEQQAIRALDSQINRLPALEKIRYLAVLRRYHNWLEALPESVKDGLLAKPPAERLAQIKTLLPRYPLPRETTPYALQFADVGRGAPFEMVREYRIWHSLQAEQRRDIEKLPSTAQRREKLLEFAKESRIRDFRPSDFRIEDWVPKVEAKIDELKGSIPGLSAAVTKAALLFEKRKPDAKMPGRPPILRQLAINLYLLEQPAPHPVSPDRLNQFVSALPPWIRSAFDAYPSDEARRRLTILYRLAYPHPEEFKPGPSQNAAGSTPSKRASTPAPPAPAPSAPTKKVPPPPRPAGSQPF
jgi:hypothetical protein